MGYSLNKLKTELLEKRYSENGLVAWGQNNNFGGIGALVSKMFTISHLSQTTRFCLKMHLHLTNQ